MACPLRSTGISPLRHYYRAVAPELRMRRIGLAVLRRAIATIESERILYVGTVHYFAVPATVRGNAKT